jgi:AraC family transcriptional regulator
MQALGKGTYTGDIMTMVGDDDVIASITCYQKSDFNNERHCHDNTNISFVIHGGCKLKKKDTDELLPGRLTFNYAGEYHQVMNVADNSRHVNIEIEQGFYERYLISENSISALTKKNDFIFLMLKIYKELVTDDQFSSPSIHLLLFNLLARAEKLANTSALPSWVKKIEELLHDGWNETITLHGMACIIGIHPVTISKYFPRYFSCTLGEYMRKLKIEKSLSLIKSPGNSLTSVAYACGFFDQSHFTRTFKEVTGFLPAQYQKL